MGEFITKQAGAAEHWYETRLGVVRLSDAAAARFDALPRNKDGSIRLATKEARSMVAAMLGSARKRNLNRT